MLVVEPRRRRDGQKKLTAVRSRPRIRHRQLARLRVLQRRMKLVAKFVARSAASAAFGASALNHKIRNDAVKNQSVIERPLFFLARALVGEFLRALGEANEI